MSRHRQSYTLSIIASLLLLAWLPATAQSSSSKIRRDQRRNRQQVEQAERNVRMNAQAVENKLSQLELLEGQVEDLNRDVRRLRGTSDSLLQLIRPLRDSIADLNGRLDGMCDKYRTALRRSQSNASSMNDLTFVFSSDNFMQAWERYRSLRQFSRWRKRKAQEIVSTRSVLQQRQTRLDSLRAANNKVLKRVEDQRNVIERKRVETDRLVKSLRTQNKQLQNVLKRRRDEARRLEERLERALAEELEQRRKQEEKERREREQREREERRQREQAAAAQQQSSGSHAQQPAQEPPAQTQATEPTFAQINSRLTGSFESNRGRLPFPLTGEFTIVKKFGRQKHPRLPKVETNNPGIDIEASQGATVYAVFEGEVSQIFKLAGYNNVVVLRHGDYVTVYANIASLNVRKGDKVKTGQALGRLFVDRNDGNRSILHFELRREKEKQNPELWLSR